MMQRTTFLGLSSLALLFVAFALTLAFFAVTRPADVHDASAAPRLVTTRSDLTGGERAQIELFRASSPSVAHITTSRITRDRFLMRAMEVPQGTGSGFVWDEKGYIVTNFHVVQSANRAYVSLDGQDAYEADLVGAEPSFDIAVLKIDAPKDKLRPIPVGTSADLQVGQNVYAIGNPFGLDHTLSTGVISGLNREIQSPAGTTIRGAIQTDAAINPGNSGGPLLDSAGRLIGMNAAIATPSGGSVGIGFAIPVDTIQRIVPGLIRQGRVTRPVLGIRAASPEVARYLGARGVVVGSVDENGGAARAGLRAMRFDSRDMPADADVITKIDGVPVTSVEDIWQVMGERSAGDTVKVEYLRGGEKRTAEITLSAGS